jgi:hypothetical protein
MNHTTLLRETRAQKSEQQDSTLKEFGLERNSDEGPRAQGE